LRDDESSVMTPIELGMSYAKELGIWHLMALTGALLPGNAAPAFPAALGASTRGPAAAQVAAFVAGTLFAGDFIWAAAGQSASGGPVPGGQQLGRND
jgi:hypothetical protein